MKNKEKAQFNTDLNYNEKQELDTILKEKGITKTSFIRMAKKMLEKGEFDMEKLEGELNMKEKKELVENMISKIIEKAINSYTEKFDENAGISIIDWKNGYKGVIRGFDGEIVKYISHSDFKDLYSNFKYDLDKASEDTLNTIIKYLEEEAKYTNYEDLDRDTNCIEDFE